MFYAGVIVGSCIKNGMIEFDFKTRTVDLPDGGIHPFSAATLGTLGEALVAALGD